MKDLPDCFLFNGSLFCAEDYLDEVKLESEDAESVLNVVEGTFLDHDFNTRWKPYRIELVKNKHLESEFEEKKQDLLIRGRKGNELEELWTFVVENNVASLETNAAIGMQTHDSDYNALGYSRLGVYVCRNADIAIQHALIKHTSSQVIRLLVCKCVTGRQTTAIPRPASASEFIEPTQGYDCHVSALPPTLSDPLQTQYDRSQIYCYEINKLLQPSTRPRQVYPYAVVTYTENGAYVPLVDAKPTAKEKVAGNPRLQEIIKAINAKADATKNSAGKNGSPATPASPPAGHVQGPSIITGSPSPSSSAGSPGGLALAPGPQSPPIPSHPVANGSVTIPTVINGHLNGFPGMALMGRPGSEIPGSDTNPQLKAIISQINARLEAEQKVRPGIIPTVTSKGDGLLPSPPVASATPPGGAVLPSPASMTLNARPASTDGLLTAMPPMHPAPNPSIQPTGLIPQRMGLQLPEAALKGAPLTALAPGQPQTQPTPLGAGAFTPTNFLTSRKNPLTMDPFFGQYQLAGLQQAAALQSLAGAGRMGAAPGLPSGLPAGTVPPAVSMPSSLMPTMPTLPVSTYTNQAQFGIPPGYQLMNTLPTATPTAAAGSMTQIQQNPLAMRTALKRPFPDTTGGLLEWDKRPKYF